MNGNSFFDEKLIHRNAVLLFSGLHIMMAVLFLLAGAYIQFILCLLFPLVYTAITTKLIKREKYLLCYMTTHTEIILIVITLILLSGWDCSFDTYLFASITASFYFTFNNNKSGKHTKHGWVPLILSTFSILTFFLCWILCRVFQESFPNGFAPFGRPKYVDVFYIFNTVFAFGLIIIFSYLFVWELENRQKVLASQNEKLDELAHKDSLTKLLNRRSMDQMIALRMQELKTSGKRFTMILCDIDDFKKVNDTYGHDAGDQVLVSVANTIQNSVRSNDEVCRWGGEEILILVNDPLDAASLAAERIRKNIESLTVDFHGQKIHITMTFGIAESFPGYRIEQLIRQADDKLYYGKKHGKNQVVTHLPKEESADGEG
jgi:diguanylate cyclase (GGDEF)-like protein